MCGLLEDMLKKDNFKYHINNRLKDVASLSEKIERKRNKGTVYKHLQDINDIVGIRIIFYTETDKKNFIKILKDDLKDAMKIKRAKGPHGYSSTHVIASLGEKRSALSEYKRFKDLKCEIQLTLILNHAWAEIEHDILYKADKAMSQIDSTYHETLKVRMEKIMSHYIKKASFELEKISQEIKKIKQG
jgi:ppGpp synthetase/RelA/SpoT-type nucleotidyltranferase